MNCISGNNGEGKTNLLDAIYYLSMTKSAFPAPDRYNWRFGTEGFTIGGTYLMDNGLESRFSIRVAEGEKKLVRDEKPCTRISEHIGVLPVVMVSPGDIALVSESGEERRRFVNGVLSQMDRSYLAAVQTYNRLLAQRNKMLKDGNVDWELMDVFDARMAAAAQPAYEARKRFAEDLWPVIQSYYKLISGGSEEVTVEYRSDLAKAPLEELLRNSSGPAATATRSSVSPVRASSGTISSSPWTAIRSAAAAPRASRSPSWFRSSSPSTRSCARAMATRPSCCWTTSSTNWT